MSTHFYVSPLKHPLVSAAFEAGMFKFRAKNRCFRGATECGDEDCSRSPAVIGQLVTSNPWCTTFERFNHKVTLASYLLIFRVFEWLWGTGVFTPHPAQLFY